MALFKVFKGNDTEKLSNYTALPPTDGYAYYDTNTKLFYIDADYDSNGTITRRAINAAQAGIAGNALNGIFYGTCGTAQSTKGKVAVIEDSLGFLLQTGTIVVIKFTNASAASTMTLTLQDKNGNTIGAAKNLELYDTTVMSSGTTTNGWRAGAVVPFVYDGANWIRFFWENSTYYYTSAYCTTGADTAAKVGAYSGIQTLTGSRYFQIWIQNTNTATSALTLNMNSLGAKKIYLNGEPTSSTNYNLLRGCYLVYYDADGDNGNGCYHFRTDNKIPGNLAGNASTATKLSNTPNNTTTYLRGDNSWQTLISSGTSALTWNSEITLATVGGTAIKAKLPANPNADTKVTQNNTTTANDYRILLSTSATDNAETNTVNKNTNLRYNPSTNTLSTGNITGTGSLNITGNVNLNGETYITSANAGSLLVSGNANFVQIPTAPTPDASSNDTSVATTAFVTSALTSVSSPMRFIGSLGTGGTATSLPAASAANQGYTYKVITANTYQGVAAKVGDILVSNGSSWILIPSGDEPSGTVTSITLKAGNGITLDTDNSAITTSGTRTISHKDTSSVSNLTANGRTYVTGLTFDTYGHVIGYTTGTETVTNSDTKNTAGSTDTSSKIYLIGATSQADNPQTYSDNEVFATSGVLTAKTFNSTSLTASQAVSTDANKNLVSTNLTVSDPTASGTGITYIATISQNATGKITATKSTVRSASTSQTGVTQYTADNLNTWINQLGTGSSTPVDADYYISQYVGGGTTTTTYHRRPMSALWTYIKGKITAGTYWANIKISDAAKYNTAPEMATLKLNGNTNATAASTSNVTLVYDTTLQALNFVFT